MTTTSPGPERPRSDLLLRFVRNLAKDTENVILSNHAMERMAERDILDAEVFRILRNGTLSSPLTKSALDASGLV